MNTSYVLDTSVLIQSVIVDTESSRVTSLLALLEQSEAPILHTAEFCLVECANVLWKRVRFFSTTNDEAQQSIRSLLILPLTIHAAGPLLTRALDIALASKLAVYDCVHIALAETLRCPLITVD